VKNKIREDISSVKKLDKVFLKNFAKYFPDFAVFEDTKFCKYLGYGAEKIYRSSIQLPEMTEKEKKSSGLQNNNDCIKGLIWLSSDINPNGITGKNDIDRTYVIKVKFYGVIRYTQRKYKDGVFAGLYCYGRNIDETIKNFNEWVINVFLPFQKSISNKKYHWKYNNGRDSCFKY
jgi:hypothetical protein